VEKRSMIPGKRPPEDDFGTKKESTYEKTTIGMDGA
jgi:hypothetical protein